MAAGKTRAAAPRTETARPKAAAPAGRAVPPDRVAERAYQVWLQSGCPEGRDQEHWLQAERELRAGRPA